MLERGAVELLPGVKDLERKNGEPIYDEPWRFRVEWRGRMTGCGFEQCDIDPFSQVIADLIKAVDLALDAGDGGIGGAWVASFVFTMPEVEVGLMLVENKLLKLGRCGRCIRRVVMAMKRGLVVQSDDAVGVEHACEA